MCGMLNWRGSTPFGELCGVFPLESLPDLESTTMINFSSDTPMEVSKFAVLLYSLLIHTFFKLLHPYSRFDVTRGFTTNTVEMFNSWLSKVSSSYVKRCD